MRFFERRIVSVEPLPKQGCEHKNLNHLMLQFHVSVEPLPKQGCEENMMSRMDKIIESQWNPCRSRGARSLASLVATHESLSGTPAEAGVRDG